MYLVRLYHRRKKIRSPFTQNLLRNPGEYLYRQLTELDENIQSYVMGAFIIPFYVYSSVITHLYLTEKKPVTMILLTVFANMIILSVLIYKLVKALNLRRKIRLGYDGEMMVGQQLNLLINFRAYHDFQAEGFNIDHILVGYSGVFAVETKTRSKPVRGRKQADAKIVYDGEKLRFPGWSESESLQQAADQAEYLSKWIYNETGERVYVGPVLVFPGWFVERTAPPKIHVINDKQVRWIKGRSDRALSGKTVERICEKLEKKCRNIEPLVNLYKQ